MSRSLEISRRMVLKGAALIGGLATLEAVTGCAPTAPNTPDKTESTSPAATAPTTVTTPAKKFEQWLPPQGDFLAPANLHGKTPEQIKTMGHIKAADVHTVDDLGHQLGYRMFAMDYSGRTPEDLAPFRDPDGQIGVPQGEAFIQTGQKNYLKPLMESIGVDVPGTDFTTGGFAQNNRAVLFDYAFKEQMVAIGGKAGADLQITMNFVEGSLVDGDLGGASSVVKLTFQKQSNGSQTTTGKQKNLKDVNQYETSLYKVTRVGDSIFVLPTGTATTTPVTQQ